MSPPAGRAASSEFGRRVRGRRLELGWSQMRLADEAGLHFTYVSSVERGERNISLQNILRLATALGIDPGELLAGLAPDR
jgi:transcriptional regulator with XRE-family HTH domain